MDISIFKVDQPAVARAYMAQYVALVLIILTFVIGSFSSQRLASSRHIEQKKSLDLSAYKITEPAVIDELKSVLTFKQLFVEDGRDVHEAAAKALSVLLKSHDIDASIEIHSHNDLSQALWRSLSLNEFLAAEGVPAQAFNILVIDKGGVNTDTQALIHLSKAAVTDASAGVE